MGNTEKTKKSPLMLGRENTLLNTVINLSELVVTQPGLFEFQKLSFINVIELLECDVERYRFLLKDCNAIEKFNILIRRKLASIHCDFELTDEELKSLPESNYVHLLNDNFNKYIRKERFLKLRKSSRSILFQEHPDWYIKEISTTEYPKLSSIAINNLARTNPEFIQNYITDLSKLSTTYEFWDKMITFNPKYEMLFIKHASTLITKTEVRSVFHRYPRLLKLVDKDNVTGLKLTIKEFMLLADQLMRDSKFLNNWEMSDELIEAIKLDVTAEFLNGTSKLSKRFSNSLKNITTKVEDSETETVE